jgi:hypothetical protein
MSIDITQLEVVINSIINMNQKMQTMETKFQTKVDSLEEENRQLYKRIEKLSETNAQNEMEKEDKNAFINRLTCRVKKLYRDVKKNEDYITTLFENDENRHDMNETNNENIKSLFQNCELYEDQIAILFENDGLYSEKINNLIDINNTSRNNIDIAIKKCKQNYIDREAAFEYNEINDKNIKKLFRKCDLYKTQIEVLFDSMK